MIESTAHNCRKLKRNELIDSCFSRGGIIRIKQEERARPVKIFRMEKLDFDFGDADEGDDIFLNVSAVASDFTSY